MRLSVIRSVAFDAASVTGFCSTLVLTNADRPCAAHPLDFERQVLTSAAIQFPAHPTIGQAPAGWIRRLERQAGRYGPPLPVDSIARRSAGPALTPVIIATRKPYGSFGDPEEILRDALMNFRLMQSDKTSVDFGRLVDAGLLRHLADTLVLGPQGGTSEFKAAFPRFAEELIFVRRLMRGEDLTQVMLEVLEFFGSDRPFVNAESLEIRAMDQPLIDPWTYLPLRAASILEGRVLRLFIHPVPLVHTPQESLEIALDIWHELYETLIVALDPTLTDAQLASNAAHTQAALGETAFGGKLVTERARRQLLEMPGGDPAGAPLPKKRDGSRIMSIVEFAGIYDDVVHEIQTDKYPLALDTPNHELTVARQSYALAHAAQLHGIAEKALKIMDAFPLDPEYTAHLAARSKRMRKNYRPAIRLAKTWLEYLAEAIVAGLRQAQIELPAYLEYLNDGEKNPEIETILTRTVTAMLTSVDDSENHLAIDYFQEYLEQSYRQAAEKLGSGYCAIPRLRSMGPNRSAKPLSPQDALALPELHPNRENESLLVWNPAKTKAGEWEFMTVWEIRRAIDCDGPYRIEALASDGGVEFGWVLSDGRGPSPHDPSRTLLKAQDAAA